MKSSYQNVLQLTEKIESTLEGGDVDIISLLGKWQEAFGRLPQKIPSHDMAIFAERIVACQERCMLLALKKKKEVLAELLVAKNKKRLHQAYGKHAVTG